MLQYNFQVRIPSLGRNIAFRELCLREIININKSIINEDVAEIILCFNRVIAETCQEDSSEFTLFDKTVALLNLRAYSMGNFCDIIIHDNIENRDIKHVLEINKIITNLVQAPIIHKKTVTIQDLTIGYGIPLNPTSDEAIQVADYIHYVDVGGKRYIDYTAPYDERMKLVDSIDIEMFNTIVDYGKSLAQIFESHPLYIVNSPFNNGQILINQRMSLSFGLYSLLKMLFTENLHNLYRSIYNFNKALQISPQYVEGITLAEKDLIWGYHIQEEKEKERTKANNGSAGTPFMP